MRLNRTEKLLMNNPVRAAFLRSVEAPLLRQLGGAVRGAHVLEVGCGSGVGTESILSLFGAGSVHAIDVDPEMVARAQRRLRHHDPERVHVAVGDVTRIEAESATYDAVFDFAIVHHVPVWQGAVAEIRRVLKPGGLFFFEEVTQHFLDKWFVRRFLDHPSENRFSASTFVAELERQGLRVNNNYVERGGGDYVFGVAHKVNVERTDSTAATAQPAAWRTCSCDSGHP